MKRIVILILLLIPFILLGCEAARQAPTAEVFQPESWNEVLSEGSNRTVTILMWGGNEQVNQYMDGFVASALQEKYGITLRRIPMDAPEFMSKLINEKRSGIEKGNADLIWINAENFRTAKEIDLLWGPFTHLLPNLDAFYDPDSIDLHFDSGIAIEGYEALWGRAQLVFTYDAARTTDPPASYADLLVWAEANPGKLTYPHPADDFVGAAFIRSSYYELTGLSEEDFQQDMSREAFRELSQPVIDYFIDLQPSLWREGTAYPASQAQLDQFFLNGDVNLTMGFEVGKTLGMIREGIYPETVETLIFETGSIGNSHYLAIPFNAPEKAGALLVIDFLQSPDAQLAKYRPEIWGDMPAFDPSRLQPEQQEVLAAIENEPGMPDFEVLSAHRLPEMRAEMIEWIKEIWQEEIGGR